MIEIRSQFDTDDTTGNLTAAEEKLQELYPADALEARGLNADALEFDFGIESDNQDDFAALGVALIVAIILTIAFLTIQFRSLIQPLLVPWEGEALTPEPRTLDHPVRPSARSIRRIR